MIAAGFQRRLAVAGGLLLALLAAAPAGAAITLVQNTSASSTTTTLTIVKPAGLTTNDVLVATVSGAGTATMSAPAGWTQIADTTTAASTMRTISFYKVATSSEVNYAFTTASARNWTGGIVAYRGVNASLPIDAVGTATDASGNPVGPSVTTTAAADWVLTSASAARNTTFTPASGTTERFEVRATSTSNEIADSIQSAAGATPTRTVTLANSTAAWVAHTIALRDATTAGLSASLDSSTASFSANLNAGDTTQTWTVDATINDTRTGTGAGWRLQVTSTTLTTGTKSMATTATDVTGMSGGACDNGAPCTLPTNSVAYPIDVPAASVAPTAVKYANAAATTGRGVMSWTTTFSVLVPQNAFAGTYTSTVTISIVSGP